MDIPHQQIGLVGALLAAAPATTETFFFLYTADGYMIAMFLAALAVYFSRMEETRKCRWFLSGLCICISCGIYQAYISFALLLEDTYEFDKIAVIGTRIYEVQYDNMNSETGKIHILSSLLEKTLLFDSDHTTKYLQATFGLELQVVNPAQRNELFNTDVVQNMDCWPSGNSIAVIDDILVIKLSNYNDTE